MNMALQIEQLVAKYRTVSQFPTLAGARVLSKDGPVTTVTSVWSQRCLEKGKNTKYCQTHLISASQVLHTSPIDVSTELMSAISPSGARRAVLRECTPAEGGAKKQHLEVWAEHRLSKVIDLTLLDQHGDVYTSGEFSCLQWSSCEGKLLYVAEKKQPKAEPFYPSKPKDKDSTVPEEKLPKKGEEHVFRQDWGETMVGQHQPVLCVLDTEAGTVSLPAGVPEGLSVGQALWGPAGDDIIAVAWPTTPRRLGLVHCTNRPSYVIHITADGSFMKLSGEKLSAHSPRLSPDKDYLVWLQRPNGGPHHAAHQLVKQVWGALPHPLVDIVATDTACTSGHTFYGLFCHSLPRHCFSDNNTLLFSANQATVIRSYILNTESGALHQACELPGSLAVLDVRGQDVLCSHTTIDTPASLLLGERVDYELKLRPVVKQDSVPPAAPHMGMRVLDLEAEVKDTVTKFNAIYYGPTGGAAKSVPLIVWPHGGPHAMYFECYSIFNHFFVNAGFATLQVNYRGSTGLGQASVDFLPGRVGDTDVKDCRQATQAALDAFPCLDPDRIVLFGGSHGGFLVAHLSGQYPTQYQAVVAVNPVTDLVSMLHTTDIPDWAVVEAGFTYTGREQVEMTPEFLAKLREVSPIRYAANVKAPTLLCIGKKDLRVPPSQGTLYYHTLNTYNVPCKMNLYEDNHSLSTVPVDLDATINAVLWFQQHLSDKQ